MTTSPEELLPTTRRTLLHRIAVAQSEGRAPSLVAAVARDGELVWTGSRTSVDGHGPDEHVQYRIGSITKTFTAVLVLRLRDEGLLDLTDPLEKHLPDTGAGAVTIAELLAHTGGLAAETPGNGGSGAREAGARPSRTSSGSSPSGTPSAVATTTPTPAIRSWAPWSRRCAGCPGRRPCVARSSNRWV